MENKTDEKLKENNLEIKEGDFGLGKNTNAEAFDKLENEVRVLKSEFENANKKVISLQEDMEKSKFDLITMLGIFVGLITYLGLEIQVFKSISNPLLIIGISIFFIASILLFILSINTIIKKYETLNWDDFKNPIYLILLILLTISVTFIIVGYHDYSKSEVLQFQF